MAMIVNYPKIKIADKGILEEIVSALPHEEHMPYCIKYYEGKIVDTIYYPKEKTKVVCNIPEGYTIFCIINKNHMLKDVYEQLKVRNVSFTIEKLSFL